MYLYTEPQYFNETDYEMLWTAHSQKEITKIENVLRKRQLFQ